jgi:hypothetical protein
LGKAKTALANFKVDPAIAVPTWKVVFLDGFFWDIKELNVNVFGIWHWSVKIEVFYVDGAEPCSLSGEDTVEEQLDEFERGRVGANVTWIADSITNDGDMGAVRVILLRMNLAEDCGVADLLALMGRDVCVCSYPPVMRGDTVKHALTSTSSPPNDVPSIPWSPVVLPLWLARAVSNRLVYLGCRTPWQLLLGNSTT